MKKYLMFLITIFMFSLTSTAKENTTESFRNVKWGTDIKELPNMRFLQKYHNYEIFTKENNKLEMGNAILSNIYYLFYENGLYAVICTFRSKENFIKLKSFVENIYKQGENMDFSNTYFRWFIDYDIEKRGFNYLERVELAYDVFSDGGYVSFFTRKIIFQSGTKMEYHRETKKIADEVYSMFK